MSADRNLLFGILALQMDFIGRDQLVAAMNAWALAKHRPLGEILVEHGALSQAKRDLLEPLVDQHVKDHGNDPQKSLAAVSSVSNIRHDLKAVPDADVQASLGFFGVDSGTTISHVPAMTDGLRFRILRPHARGGLGEVFIAKDIELNREVALKEIQPGKDRGDGRARFVFEAEVTGGLEHPGIVPVYGLGHYADGRPYYAMRFIRGDNLGEAIKRFHGRQESRQEPRTVVSGDGKPPLTTVRGSFDSLDFRRLLQRFIDVCNAVAYAHSRGVLHRDLKPGNIMLGKYGETLVVDWGLAKTQASRDHPRPEADGETTLNPTSGSDVLPTQYGSAIGTPAYMSPEQAEGKLDQLGPASDVYSLGATLYHLLVGKPANSDCDVMEIIVRSQRGDIPTPLSVNSAIPKPLNAICMKAMALKPSQRYENAQRLAADIEHWLADEPVGAFAEPLSARAKRWARKHPASVAGIAATLLVGMIGLGAGLYFVDAERKRTVAQEQKTSEALVQVTDAKKLADNRFDMALNAFNEMVFGMQNLLEKRAGTIEVRRELLVKARPGLEKLLQEAESARGANHTLVWSYFRIGDVAMQLSDTSLAKTEYQKGHDMAERLADADPKNAQAQRDLSVSFERLGDVTLRMGNAAGALEYYRKCLEVSQRLADSDPKNAQAQRDLSVSFNQLGDVTLQMGNAAGALEYYRKGLEIDQRLADADPKNAEAQRDLSVSFDRLGDVTLRMGNAAGALEYYRKGLEVSQRLADADPKDARAQRDLSVSFLKLGNVTLEMGNAAGALEYYRKGLEVSQRLADADPKDAQAQKGLFISYAKVGSGSQAAMHFAEARSWYEKALAKLEQFKAEEWIKKPEELIGNRSYQKWLDDTQRRLTFCTKAEQAVADLGFALAQPAAEIPRLLGARMWVLAKKNDTPGCMATAEAMTKLELKDAGGQYDTACLWSLCASAANDKKDECCAKAMEHLRKAVAAGYKDVGHMKMDKDLDPLRDREDFKKLIAELEAKAAAEK